MYYIEQIFPVFSRLNSGYRYRSLKYQVIIGLLYIMWIQNLAPCDSWFYSFKTPDSSPKNFWPAGSLGCLPGKRCAKPPSRSFRFKKKDRSDLILILGLLSATLLFGTLEGWWELVLLDGEMRTVSHSSTKEANLEGCDGQNWEDAPLIEVETWPKSGPFGTWRNLNHSQICQIWTPVKISKWAILGFVEVNTSCLK